VLHQMRNHGAASAELISEDGTVHHRVLPYRAGSPVRGPIWRDGEAWPT
jgi:hypothetical protein